MSVVINRGVRFDGVWCGDASGNRVEMFDPRWYRIDRWILWLFTKRPKGTLTIQRNIRGDGVITNTIVRCLTVTTQPRKFKLPPQQS